MHVAANSCKDSHYSCEAVGIFAVQIQSLFEFLEVAAVVCNSHSPEALDATRTALGSDSMQTERHAYNRTKAVPPKASHYPCSAGDDPIGCRQ